MTPAAIGQTWRRKRDGFLVRVINVINDRYDNSPMDVYWQSVENPKRKGAIYVTNFYIKYDLLEVQS